MKMVSTSLSLFYVKEKKRRARLLSMQLKNSTATYHEIAVCGLTLETMTLLFPYCHSKRNQR